MRDGELIAGRFAVERLAAQGGMGVVYRAKDTLTGDHVALKVLKENTEEADRFQREAAVLAELRHPAIVRYVAHGIIGHGKRAYLAMEWLEGEDLSVRLARQGLDVKEGLLLAIRVAEALAVAHARGITHRDIKPSNLFLPDGDLARVKVLDFGIARLGLAAVTMTQTGIMVGTPGYMSPEQARGDPLVDGRADVFALGCVLFECITGKRVFKRSALAQQLPPKCARERQDTPPRERVGCLSGLLHSALASSAGSSGRGSGAGPGAGTSPIRMYL